MQVFTRIAARLLRGSAGSRSRSRRPARPGARPLRARARRSRDVEGSRAGAGDRAAPCSRAFEASPDRPRRSVDALGRPGIGRLPQEEGCLERVNDGGRTRSPALIHEPGLAEPGRKPHQEDHERVIGVVGRGSPPARERQRNGGHKSEGIPGQRLADALLLRGRRRPLGFAAPGSLPDPAQGGRLRGDHPTPRADRRRVLRDHHDVEDASQATLLLLDRKAASVPPREKLGNWPYGVAFRTASPAAALPANGGLETGGPSGECSPEGASVVGCLPSHGVFRRPPSGRVRALARGRTQSGWPAGSGPEGWRPARIDGAGSCSGLRPGPP